MNYQIEYCKDKISYEMLVLKEGTTPEEAIQFAKFKSEEYPESMIWLYETENSIGPKKSGMQELFRWGFKLPPFESGNILPWQMDYPTEDTDTAEIQRRMHVWANIIAIAEIQACQGSPRALNAFRAHLCALVLRTHSTGCDPYDISEGEALDCVKKQNSNVPYLKKVAAFGIAAAVCAGFRPQETHLRIFLICS